MNLPINGERILSGKLEFYNNKFQISHPDNIIDVNSLTILDTIQPIYSLTKGLTQKIYYKNLKKVLDKIINLDEWIDKETINTFKFSSWKTSLMKIHQPLTNDDLIKNNNYRKRLAYDELFSNQIAISIIRKFNQKNIGINITKK